MNKRWRSDSSLLLLAERLILIPRKRLAETPLYIKSLAIELIRLVIGETNLISGLLDPSQERFKLAWDTLDCRINLR